MRKSKSKILWSCYKFAPTKSSCAVKRPFKCTKGILFLGVLAEAIIKTENMGLRIIELKVDGMDCANCAASITKFLERKGMEEVSVNFQTKEVRFRDNPNVALEEVKKGIRKLGYTILEPGKPLAWWTLSRRLLFAALFTAPLILGHLLMPLGWHIPALHHPLAQFVWCLPVFVLGFFHFGKSALSSLRTGVPNMDVLIFIGGTAAFIYSLRGLYLQAPEYIFFETSASIFTLVLLGNWIEGRAVRRTTTAIEELTLLQQQNARRIMPSGTIISVQYEELEPGFLLQVNEGDKIPADGVVRTGWVTVDESLLTGESLPVEKQVGEKLIGGSLILHGNMQMEVEQVGRGSLIGQMIELVKRAQEDKPSIQRLADRISAIFVPLVLSISLLAFLLNHFLLHLDFQQALMNSIAILVISCPCAMGLATPTAVMVGVGRLAKNGILVKGGQTLELFASVRKIVFDKTGTLTSGQFKIQDIQYTTPEHHRSNALVYFLEKHSSHPIAVSLVEELENRQNGVELEELTVVEEKGIGVSAQDKDGNLYKVGSRRIFSFSGESPSPASVFLTRNNQLLAEFYLEDDIKEDAPAVIRALQNLQIEPLIISGDHRDKTARVATLLGIHEFFAEQLPADKLELVEKLAAGQPIAMVGDGINDAPALARATVGISLGNASPTAIESAQIILLNGRLDALLKAYAICKHTVLTIKQSLGWAFAYNVIAIPMAAMGLLSPMWGALFMAFSDVVVIGNAVRLRTKFIPELSKKY